MPFVCQLSKTRGLIVVFMVLTICRFGSSPLQKRSGNCRCTLSCAELPELMKNERVEVYVQDQSGVIYNEIHEVSSLFDDEGHCSVVVPDCLQEDKKVELRIYAHNKNRPIYEKMDLKPECKTEEPPEERISSSADRISSNTLLILLIMVFFVGFKLLPKNWCRFQH